MVNRWDTLLNLDKQSGSAGSGDETIDIRPSDDDHEWLVQAVSVSHVDGADRDCNLQLYDGTNKVEFDQYTVASGDWKFLLPHPIRVTRGSYLQVQGLSFTDTSKLSARWAYERFSV